MSLKSLINRKQLTGPFSLNPALKSLLYDIRNITYTYILAKLGTVLYFDMPFIRTDFIPKGFLFRKAVSSSPLIRKVFIQRAPLLGLFCWLP